MHAVYAFLSSFEPGTFDHKKVVGAILNSHHGSRQCELFLDSYVDAQLEDEWPCIPLEFSVASQHHPKGCKGVCAVEYAAIRGKLALAKYIAELEELDKEDLRDRLDLADEYVHANAAARKKREEAIRREHHAYSYKPRVRANVYAQERARQKETRARHQAALEKVVNRGRHRNHQI